VACFSSPKTNRQLPSFHQQSTTNSPPKHHVQPPVFAKTPSKNGYHHPQKLLQNILSSSSVLAPPGEDYRDSHSVLILEIEDLGAAQPAQILPLRRMIQGGPKPQGHEVSPGNTASPKTLILWGFSRVFAAAKADNSHARTVWRWGQSEANRSPAEFPLTGKNTGIFREFVLNYRTVAAVSKQWLHKTGN
jgi:hypothetical protein